MPCRPSVLPNSMSIGLCRFCGELGAEREDLAAGGLALVEEERQQILQIVGARGCRLGGSDAAERDVEQRRLDVVERLAGVGRQRRESLRPARQRRQRGWPASGSTTQNATCEPVSGLHVHRDPPRLPAVFEHANLQVRARGVVFALEAIGTTAQHTVENGHDTFLRMKNAHDPRFVQVPLRMLGSATGGRGMIAPDDPPPTPNGPRLVADADGTDRPGHRRHARQAERRAGPIRGRPAVSRRRIPRAAAARPVHRRVPAAAGHVPARAAGREAVHVRRHGRRAARRPPQDSWTVRADDDRGWRDAAGGASVLQGGRHDWRRRVVRVAHRGLRAEADLLAQPLSEGLPHDLRGRFRSDLPVAGGARWSFASSMATIGRSTTASRDGPTAGKSSRASSIGRPTDSSCASTSSTSRRVRQTASWRCRRAWRRAWRSRRAVSRVAAQRSAGTSPVVSARKIR